MSADSVNTTGTRTKRAADTGYSSGAAVYTPRVWDETANAWVSSPQVEVVRFLSETYIGGAKFSPKHVEGVLRVYLICKVDILFSFFRLIQILLEKKLSSSQISWER